MRTADRMLDSPIKWVGGKSNLRAEVIARLPSDAECYAEVFAGALWVLMGKRPHPVEVVNDRDDSLVNLWRVLKWRRAELLERVQQCLYSRTTFYELREQEPSGMDELERAAWLYQMIQMSFGADITSSRSASFGYWNKARGALFLSKSLQQFGPAQERLRDVFIENLDFADLIERYDQPATVFYCDPPYLETCGYSEAFDMDDHKRLREALGGIEGRFLVTVNDHPAIRELYAGFQMETANEARAKARASEGRVAAPILFLSNYDTSAHRGHPARIMGFGPEDAE